MRFKGLAVILALAFLVGVAGTGFAQEQTGGIQGVIKDASGAVLPGATVEARNVSVNGVQTAVTDAKGVYRFPALPPGTYEVTATLQGFTTAKAANVMLVLGKLITVDLSLSIGTVKENVEVKAEVPLIDVKQNAAFTSIRQDTIDKLPKGRDFTTILKTAAGAQDETRNGGIQVDGASGTENRFVVDGMDTTSLSIGDSGKTLLLDFVQEVQVKSSGYNAEFGGATGGVVSAITKSGSNQIRGQVGTYYQTNKSSLWIGDRRRINRYDPYVTTNVNTSYVTPDVPYTYISPLADIGGPIFKDRLWYYAGFGYTKNDTKETATFYADANRIPRSFESWNRTFYYNYNLSWQVGNNLRVKLSGQNERYRQRGSTVALQPQNYQFPDGTIARIPYTTSTFDKAADGVTLDPVKFNTRYNLTGSDSATDIFSGNLDWVVTNSFFVNASGGFYKTNSWTPTEWRGTALRHVFGNNPSDATMTSLGFPTIPASYQQASGYADNISSAGTEKNKYTRIFGQTNLTFFLNAGGQHTFKAGARYERLSNDAVTGATYPTVTLNWGQTASNSTGATIAGRYGYYTVNQVYTGGNVASNNWAFWLQDSWNLSSRFTLNFGVRAENEFLPAYNADFYGAAAQSIKYNFTDKIAPRAGFAWDLKGDGRWKAYGSFGFYYTITPLQLARGSMGGEHWIDYNYTLDTYDWASINCQPAKTGCPGTFITAVDARVATNLPDPNYSAYFGIPNMTGIDKNIKPVKTAEFTAGLDHELNPLMSVGLRYVHKWAIRAQDDVGVMLPDGSEYYVLTNPGEGFGKYFEPTLPTTAEAKPKRNYDAVELKLRRRLSNNWSAEFSYTWSRLFGNWSGLTSSDEPSGSNAGRTGSPDATRYWDNLIMSYDTQGHQVYGLLATDRPHTFKVQATYAFKFGLSAGVYWTAQSGTPQTTAQRIGQVIQSYAYPVYIYGRNDLGRSPMFSQLDLVLAQDIKFGKRVRLTLQANVDNLLDQAVWTAMYNQAGYGPDPYRQGMTYVLPNANINYKNGYNLVAMNAAYTGTHQVNTLYTTPNSFQGRRQLRVSAKIQF